MWMRRIGWFILCGCGLLQSSYALPLSAAEQHYVKAHPEVTVCVDPDWPPFEVITPQGQHYGIAADLLHLALSRVGLKPRLYVTRDWKETLAASKSGQCQIMSFLNRTPERSKWLDFTAPLFNDVNVFITREEHELIRNPLDLRGENIVFPVATAMEERFKVDYPNIPILHTDSETEALELVNERKASMTLRSLTVAAYTIKKEGWFNLKIAGSLAGYDNQLRVGVRHGQPELLAIIDQGVRSISDSEREQIVNRHIPITVATVLSDRAIVWILLALMAVLGVGVMWNLRLKKSNRQLQIQSHTDALTGLPNRYLFQLQFSQDQARAYRSQQPLTILVIDIDHFKRVNDQFGHLIGDEFLVQFSKILRECARLSDCPGRWGGEEFVVMCPDTPIDKAVILAERILQAVREAHFPTNLPHSVSIGIASLRAEDTLNTLFERADAALYQVKHQGRDGYGIEAPPASANEASTT